MNRIHSLLVPFVFTLVAAPAAAQERIHTLRIDQVDDATADVRGAGRGSSLCEGSCELTLADGDYTIESSRLRGHRPIPITVTGDGSVEIRTRSRRWVRILGGIGGAVVSSIGLGILVSSAMDDCDEGLCFRELGMRIGGAVLAGGLMFGLSLTLIRDRTIRVEPGPLR